MDNITYLTIEERIELYKKNMAFSPSDAARKVTSLAEASVSEIIDDTFLEKDKIPGVMYGDFCRWLCSVISEELGKTDKSPYKSRFGNGCSDFIYITALSLASLPERLESNYKFMPKIYYDLRMTLGNYLDALIDISSKNTDRANQYRKLKEEFSGIIDLTTPLCRAISILLDQYSNSHAELDRLSHIQSCKSALDARVQPDEVQEEVDDEDDYPFDYDYDDKDDSLSDDEDDYPFDYDYDDKDDSLSDDEDDYPFDYDYDDKDDERDYDIEIRFDNGGISSVEFVNDDDFGDDFDDEFDDYYDDYDDECMELKADRMLLERNPYEYYLGKARELPDICEQSPKSLYEMGTDNPNLLADYDYSPEGFKARIDAAELPADFRKIAHELITPESIASAFKGMDEVTDRLCRLLIEPFAEIGNYRFERHTARDVKTV